MSPSSWAERYRDYQFQLATRYLIPTLMEWGVTIEGRSLLEIGCGDGGCGAAFYRQGSRVVMMDIDERLVATAEELNRIEGVEAKTFVSDVFDDTGAAYQEGPFDLIMFRDVMEHLADPVRALEIVRKHLTEEGRVFVVFPPYYSPYGAHQQILPRKTFAGIPYNKLPYIQFLPMRGFRSLVAGNTAANTEVARLHEIRLTIRGFEEKLLSAGFRVCRKRMYLSRPTFALRYGLPVVGASLLGQIPFLNEVLVTAAYYLLEPDSRVALCVRE